MPAKRSTNLKEGDLVAMVVSLAEDSAESSLFNAWRMGMFIFLTTSVRHRYRGSVGGGSGGIRASTSMPSPTDGRPGREVNMFGHILGFARRSPRSCRRSPGRFKPTDAVYLVVPP